MKYSSIALGVSTIATPFVAYAQSSGTPNSIGSLAKLIVKLLNTGSLMLVAASTAVYLGVAFFQIWDVGRGKVKRSEATSRLLWGIVIIFFMVSVWGIVQVLQYTFFGGPSPQNSNGVIYYSSGS